MKPADLIAHYGTQQKAAAALDVSQGTISIWLSRNKIPVLRQMQAERLTGGALCADADVLRAHGLAA